MTTSTGTRLARFARPGRWGQRGLTERRVLREGAATPGVARRERMSRRALALADALGAVLALSTVILAAGGRLTWPILLAMPLTVAVNRIADLYDRDELVLNKTTLDEVPQLLQISGLSALVTWLVHGPLLAVPLGPGGVLALWTCWFLVLVGGRVVARWIPSRIAGVQRCLVVGEDDAIRSLSERLREAHVGAEVVAGVVVGDPLRDADLSERVRRTVRDENVHRVIVAPSRTDSEDMLEVIRIAKLEGVGVTVLPRLFEVVGSSIEFDHVDGITMLGVRRFGLSRSSRIIKRGFDLAGSCVLLLAAAPLMALIALAIRLETPGRVLFRQTRVGKDGQRFEMLKFRSMVADAEDRKESLRHLNETVGLFKIAADPRITGIGRLLRASSLDELPQLFNVVRGEMSLVGPRPLVVDEDIQVQGLDRARLHLTPGMTGPWQVLGSGRIPMNQMLMIDYLYVANWSLWTDAKILLRTIPHVVSARGS